MSNNQLPVDVQERIKADAEAATDKEEVRLKALNQEYGRMISQLHGHEAGYIAGATAETQWRVKYDELKVDYIDLGKRHNTAQTTLTEQTIQYQALKERCDKMARELNRCLSSIVVHPDYQPNSEFRDLAESINEALKEGESNTPVPVQGCEPFTESDAEFMRECNLHILTNGGAKIITENDEGSRLDKADLKKLAETINRYLAQ